MKTKITEEERQTYFKACDWEHVFADRARNVLNILFYRTAHQLAGDVCRIYSSVRLNHDCYLLDTKGNLKFFTLKEAYEIH